jgi:tRNA(Ile)-lysidine synthase
MTPPLSWQEFSRLLPVPLRGRVAVAVSGGADSMALCLLLADWCAHTPGLSMVALTVDHDLRPESKSEAQTVHNWLSLRGIEHHILTWSHGLITTGIQKKARQARYELLDGWCVENSISALLTAHHALDQWETVMMRLAKGSGLTGLCGIRSVVSKPFGVLVRPLLSVSPEQILQTLQHYNQPFLNDPSNHNNAFTRVRFRRMYDDLAQEGLGIHSILETLGRLQQAENYLQEETQKAYVQCVIENHIDLEVFLALPLEIAQRLLQKSLQHVGGAGYPLPQKSIVGLYEKLKEPYFSGATAGGCVLKKVRGGYIRISQEQR